MQTFGKVVAAFGVAAIGLTVVGAVEKPDSVYKNDKSQQNPMEGKKVRFVENNEKSANADGVCGQLEVIGETDGHRSTYDKVWKRVIDSILSFCSLVVLSPVLIGLSLAIVIDDPGPVLFVQKRIGKNKQYFRLHKYRSMKVSTPHDIPTHMLENPEQYITKVGRFIRAYSLDELPQIWDIFVGNMSFIGPRPALWNQELLISERDKLGVNDIRPGLTGWAQINGRDELEIDVKVRLDGEYASRLARGGFGAFMFDCRCFIGTIFSVLRSDGVVEGGTGVMNKKEQKL